MTNTVHGDVVFRRGYSRRASRLILAGDPTRSSETRPCSGLFPLQVISHDIVTICRLFAVSSSGAT